MNKHRTFRSLRTLVIPDIHNDVLRAEAAIAALAGRYDRIVFLGDYFDDFGDSPERIRLVAQWLKYSVEQPERTHLVGNHDLAYLAPSVFTCCSGFTPEKLVAVAPVLRSIPRDRFHAAVEVDGWLLSHAGVLPHHGNNRSAAEIALWADTMLRQLFAGGRPALFAAGAARGGREPTGGITWCDWDEEFVPTDGLHQVVGHSPGGAVRIVAAMADGTLRRAMMGLPGQTDATLTRCGCLSVNMCIDTRLLHVAILRSDTCTVIPLQREEPTCFDPASPEGPRS